MLSKEVGIFQRENDFFKWKGENSQLNKLKKGNTWIQFDMFGFY